MQSSLMLVFYCYFVAFGSGSAVAFMMLQSLPYYNEQLVGFYGVSILTNLRHLLVRAVFYCLYGVSLYLNN